MSQPAITVLMPVYNAQLHLKEAIESILNQTFTDFEFLIINDGSTDNSEQIIKSYSDPRINYVKNEANIKLIATLNNGFAIAKGQYIARMDADDISLPERLAKQFAFMESHPEVSLAGTWFESIGEINAPGKYESDINLIRLKMLYQTQFCHPSVIIRKEAIKSIPVPFDPAFIHAEDYELFSQLTYHGITTNIPEVLIKYRVHAANVSIVYRDIQIENSIRIRLDNFKIIGVDATADEAVALELLAYQKYDQLRDKISLLESLLTKMAFASRNNKFIAQQVLLSFVRTNWFNLCYNLIGRSNTLNQIFHTSPLTRKYISLKERLKFYLKFALKG
ncbi:MAG: glycosyl transferase family 2 [Bacteroidota bacterium]|nr:glycosyl transferase family 2 [Bacteroidota bacterium]